MNKLIFKVEFDKQTKNAIKINSEIDSWRICFKESFGEIVDWAMRMSCYDKESKELLGGFDKLEHLKRLIVVHGFKLTLKEAEKEYELFISKKTNSIAFKTNKENKIETLFLQAEEWANEFLEELSHNKSL